MIRWLRDTWREVSMNLFEDRPAPELPAFSMGDGITCPRCRVVAWTMTKICPSCGLVR